MSTQNGKDSLHIGIAYADITPKANVQLSGIVQNIRHGQSVLDRLHAKALVVESQGRKLCLVALDVTLITRKNMDRIRTAAAERHSIDISAVMIHATQTHSAPSIGRYIVSDYCDNIPPEMEWLTGSNPEYDAYAEEAIVNAIDQAFAALQPVEIGLGRGMEGQFAFNRRAIKRNGEAFMPGPSPPKPLGWTDILYMEGPIDPELGVMCFRTESLDIPTVVVNYTCHPVHVFPKPVVSADWPGALSDSLRAKCGDKCLPLVVNGACGDVNPWPPFNPDYVEDHCVMGEQLANIARDVMDTLTFSPNAVVDCRTSSLKIPLREVDPDQLAEAKAILVDQPTPCLIEIGEGKGVASSWLMAVLAVDLDKTVKREQVHDYEIQVFRIGDAAFVGLPGEPFAEGGLRIKRESPAEFTWIAHDVNQYVGYIPTKRAFAAGGHELATGNWSRLVPEALDMIVEESVRLLNELFHV